MASKAKKRGRKPDSNSKSGKIRELLAGGEKPADIAKKLGCTTGLVYNVRTRMANRSAGAAKKGVAKKAKRAPSGKMDEVAGLQALVRAVEGGEQDRLRMRGALERIRKVIDDALA
ncbi:MAG: hypothetical protein KAI24_19235 [Planctomycetes bacterium]|nr:hypothetical protein [Planctomycetota bacterium]